MNFILEKYIIFFNTSFCGPDKHFGTEGKRAAGEKSAIGGKIKIKKGSRKKHFAIFKNKKRVNNYSFVSSLFHSQGYNFAIFHLISHSHCSLEFYNGGWEMALQPHIHPHWTCSYYPCPSLNHCIMDFCSCYLKSELNYTNKYLIRSILLFDLSYL